MKVRLSAKNLIDNSICHSIDFEFPELTLEGFLQQEKQAMIDLFEFYSEPIKKQHNIPHGYSQYYRWCIYEVLNETGKVIYTREI